MTGPADRLVGGVERGIGCLPALAEGVLTGILSNTGLAAVWQALLQTLRRSSSEKPAVVAVSNLQN